MWEERSVLKQEQIATCLEYLDSGGILVVFQPIIPPYPLSYVGNGIVKRGLDVISQIIGRGEFYDISDFDIPEPLIPLVLRSQNKLERLLKRGVSFQAELEFYPSWPEGLGTLLQAGYEPDKETMGRALNSGTAAVRVLKDTGKLYPELCIPFLAECPYPTAREIVVQELAEERKQLWNTALTHLPMETLLQLNIRPDTVLGFNAAQVHCLLETHGVNTNHIGSREGWLIYRAAKLNTELANQMWDHGFRDVDEKDDMGMTALMKLQSFLDFGKGPPALKLLEMASWLIKKGADGRLCPKICDYSALHFVAASLAESLGSWGWVATQSETIENLLAKMNPLSQLPSSLEAVLHSILLDDSRDSCSCYCSPTGCTPLAVFLGALTKGRNDIYYVKGIAKVILPSIFASLPSKSPESFEERVIPQALRLITFEALEISHTCAHPTYQWSILGSSDDSGITAHPAVPYAQRLVFQPFEPEEVKEIHEEEAALIEELESLVMEFISDYKRLCLPFEVFIQEHWWVRMQEVLDRQEPPTEEQIDQIQGIGVVLESQSEEGLDSETDDYLK
ncbi:uncharacterized protein N7496_006375 [Penicillium cataractarum]|uniref:Uncharacterized protein n=1 Tax=Penicillium cataractarum TaxID=2100454 RepID=A0A9W9V635_9EURO|nr:uncharacterized protein N7496_006375 [Penicillium cataractarum]KAJ5370283.1 hypothetical protein N7496_006375 [Penicillium cataractarum]